MTYFKVFFVCLFCFINGALLVFIYTYSHEAEPAEWIQAASCESRLLLLLQVQSNLLGLFLWPSIISRYIYLSRSHLWGLDNIVAVVNKTFSFGLVHVWQCFDLVGVCVCVCDLFVATQPNFYGRVVFKYRKSPPDNLRVTFGFSQYRVAFPACAGSCVRVFIMLRDTLNKYVYTLKDWLFDVRVDMKDPIE